LGTGAGLLVSPHDGPVDHRVFVVGISCEMLKEAFPYPGFGPAAEPPVRVLPVPEALRQVAPLDSRALSIQSRLDEAAIVAGGDTDITWLAGKQILDPSPLIVAKSISGHASALYEVDSACFT
jgi:hypothetical protein